MYLEDQLQETCFTDMVRDEYTRSWACVNCLKLLIELANLSLRFRNFKDTLCCIYSKVENNKYPTNKILRS